MITQDKISIKTILRKLSWTFGLIGNQFVLSLQLLLLLHGLTKRRIHSTFKEQETGGKFELFRLISRSTIATLKKRQEKLLVSLSEQTSFGMLQPTCIIFF